MLAFPPDSSFLVQIASFVVLWLVLRKLAWEPMLAVLSEREERTLGNHKRAEGLRMEVREAEKRFEAEMSRARAQLAAEAAKSRAEMQEIERFTVQQARREAAEALGAARAALDREAEQARIALDREAEEIGRSMARTVLGREVAG